MSGGSGPSAARRGRYMRLCTGVAGIAFALGAPPAWAQDAADQDRVAASPSLDSGEIVVTAQRRTQNLQDVGIAVATYSGDALKALGLSLSTDIGQLTPGVYVAGTLGGQTQQFTIRGVTQSDYNDALEAPVAVYIDEVYIPAQQGQTLALFDVERVEVLKGPQGTLFGRNATGGLVNTLVVQPRTDRVGGYFDVSYARFNEVRAEAAINLPLSANAALRVSGYYNVIDNYWDNRYPAGVATGARQNFGPPGAAPSPCCQDVGGSRTYAGRAQLKLEPSDDLTIRFSASGTKQKMSTAPYTASATIGTYDAQGRYVENGRASPTETRLAIGPNGGNYADFSVLRFAASGFPGNATRVAGGTWFGYVPLDPEDLALSSDFARQRLNTVSAWTGSAHVDYDFGGVELASITAYQRHDKRLMMDADGSPANLFLFGTRARTSAFSQEVRLSGGDDALRWTAGVYYLDLKTRATQGLLGARGSLFGAAFGFATQGVDLNRDPRLETRSLSGFGQAEIALADKWTLVVGGRLIRERQDYDLTMHANFNANDYEVDRDIVLYAYAPPFSDERSKTLWAGKAQIEYRPFDKMLVYAGINRGVKGGSYNAPGIGTPVPPTQIPFSDETLTSYEAGFKFGDRFLALNAAGYYYDYKDYQAFLFANASGLVENVDSKVYGFDADARVQLTEALLLTLGASYSHGSIKNFEVAPGVFRTVRPTYAPRQQASAALNYMVPTEIGGGRLSFNAQGNYASGFFHNLRNFEGQWFKGRTLLNLSMGWRQEPAGMRLTAYVNNVFDKRYGLIGFDTTGFCGCTLEAYGKPRTYGLTLGYNF